MSVKDLLRRRWEAGDRLINRNEKRDAIVFKVDYSSITLVLSGSGGVLIGRQEKLEESGWQRTYLSSEAESTDLPSSGS